MVGARKSYVKHRNDRGNENFPPILIMSLERCFASDFLCEPGTYEWILLNVGSAHVRHASAALETLQTEHEAFHRLEQQHPVVASKTGVGSNASLVVSDADLLLPPLTAEQAQIDVVLNHAHLARDFLIDSGLTACAWPGSPYGDLLRRKARELQDDIIAPTEAIEVRACDASVVQQAYRIVHHC